MCTCLNSFRGAYLGEYVAEYYRGLKEENNEVLYQDPPCTLETGKYDPYLGCIEGSRDTF